MLLMTMKTLMLITTKISFLPVGKSLTVLVSTTSYQVSVQATPTLTDKKLLSLRENCFNLFHLKQSSRLLNLSAASANNQNTELRKRVVRRDHSMLRVPLISSNH